MLAAQHTIRYTGSSAESAFCERRGMSVNRVPIRRHTSLSWLCRGLAGRAWCRPGSRFSALCTVLALLSLLTVSGPHRVHHLIEMPPQPDHHAHHHQQPVSPDCPVFFLWQHTPVAAHSLVCLPALLATSECIVSLLPLWVSAETQNVSQARAPPPLLLL